MDKFCIAYPAGKDGYRIHVGYLVYWRQRALHSLAWDRQGRLGATVGCDIGFWYRCTPFGTACRAGFTVIEHSYRTVARNYVQTE